MSSAVSEKNTTLEVAHTIRRQLDRLSSFPELRKEALTNFERLGLPGNRSEEYKHTPITRLLEKGFKLGIENAPATNANPHQFLLAGIDAYTIIFINGQWSEEHSTASAEEGLSLLPFTKAGAQAQEAIRTHLGKLADHSTDPFAAWNTASWTDGLYVHVKANTRIEKPILIYHIHDTVAGQIISAVRNLVVLERNSEVTVLEKFDTVGSTNGFSTIVSEGIVAENAGLNWYSIQNDTKHRFHHEVRQITQERSSRVNTFTFTLNGKIVRNNLHLALDGEGIDSHMYGLYLIGSDTIADNHTVVDHRQPNSYSNELYKGVMDGQSKGVFNGKIYVRPNAQKTNAFQANRNVLLGEQATVNTKPQLEIWADDVKCSHGCTSGQLDEEALFYLRTRGIASDTARAMMLYAFAGEVLDNVKHDGIKQYIDSLVSERLHKNF